MPDQSHWSVDKRIPVATIGAFAATIFVQSMAGVWFASAMYFEIKNTAARVAVLEQLARTAQSQGIAIAKMEERLANVAEGVRDIKIRVGTGNPIPWSSKADRQ